MKRIIERRITLVVIFLSMFITIARSNGQVLTTRSDTCVPPAISTQPLNLSRVSKGSSQTISVEATGTGSLSYQWFKSGTPAVAIGTNSNKFTLCDIDRSYAGYYYVVVTNQCGSVTSKFSGLTLELPPQSSTVSSISLAVTPAVIPFAIDPLDGTIAGVLVSTVDTPDPIISSGTRTYTYSFRNRAGCVFNWTYTYTIDDSVVLPVRENTTATIPIPEVVENQTTAADVFPEAPPSPLTEKSVCTLMIPNGFSPNGDGINDYFRVTCLDQYPDAKLKIYSRTSTLLYEQENYGNFDFWGGEDAAWWNGNDRYKNKLDSDSYIYILDLEHGKKEMIKTGVIFISR